MADDDLTAWLSDISAKDQFLKTSTGTAIPSAVLPPVRGQPAQPPPAHLPKKSAKSEPVPTPAPTPPPPKDEAAIWDDDDVPSLAEPTKLPAATAAKPAAKANGGQAKAEPVKARQRKHAYEYFNQWDAYDVDGELDKLESKKANDAEEEMPVSKANDGLPPDLTAAMLAKMPAVEIERRALNEKNKGNEAYKANEYPEAVKHYTHSLRLQQNNAVVYANRGMCYLKLKQYRQTLSDCTAAIQIDDGYTKAYLRRGIAHRRLSQTSQAIKDLDIVLHREPHNREAQEHRRCAQLEKEKEDREKPKATLPGMGAKSGKKSSVIIEEVSDDSDDETAAAPPTDPVLAKLQQEEQAKSERERARAEAAEEVGRKRSGPFVDPQAAQESDELMQSLSMMNSGSMLGEILNSDAKKAEVRDRGTLLPAPTPCSPRTVLRGRLTHRVAATDCCVVDPRAAGSRPSPSPRRILRRSVSSLRKTTRMRTKRQSPSAASPSKASNARPSLRVHVPAGCSRWASMASATIRMLSRRRRWHLQRPRRRCARWRSRKMMTTTTRQRLLLLRLRLRRRVVCARWQSRMMTARRRRQRLLLHLLRRRVVCARWRSRKMMTTTMRQRLLLLRLLLR